MRYVLDASVALKWVLIEPDAAKARQLRDDFRNGIHELIAPDSFALEIAHALTKAERRGMIRDAGGLWTDVMTTSPVALPLARFDTSGDPDRLPGSYRRLRLRLRRSGRARGM
jgi:hypothetical protein